MSNPEIPEEVVPCELCGRPLDYAGRCDNDQCEAYDGNEDDEDLDEDEEIDFDDEEEETEGT